MLFPEIVCEINNVVFKVWSRYEVQETAKNAYEIIKQNTSKNKTRLDNVTVLKLHFIVNV